jgi:adenylate kinase
MKDESRLIVVLLGGPGAGKGTQAEIISNLLGIPHISTGQLLRSEMGRGTEFGKCVRATVEAGGLVDDVSINELISNRIRNPDSLDGFILDGYPRNVQQAVALDRELRPRDRLVVIALSTHLETIVRRLGGRWNCSCCGASYASRLSVYSNNCEKCGTVLIRRTDDNEIVIRSRFATFQREAIPLAEFYTRRGVYEAINGMRPESEVADAIARILRSASAATVSNAS